MNKLISILNLGLACHWFSYAYLVGTGAATASLSLTVLLIILTGIYNLLEAIDYFVNRERK